MQISSWFDPDLPSPPAARPETRATNIATRIACPTTPAHPFLRYSSSSAPPEVRPVSSSITCGSRKLGKSQFEEGPLECRQAGSSKCEGGVSSAPVLLAYLCQRVLLSIAPSGNPPDASESVWGSEGAKKVRTKRGHSASGALKARFEGGRRGEVVGDSIPVPPCWNLLRTRQDGGRHLGTCAGAWE